MSTLDQAAAYVDVSSRWLSELISRGAVTRQKAGEYDLGLVFREYCGYLRVRGVIKRLPDMRDLEFVADAILLSLKVSKRAGLSAEQCDVVEAELTASVESFVARCSKHAKGGLHQLVDEETAA